MEKELQIVFLMGNQHKGRGIGDPFWVFETERTPGPFPRIPTHLFVLVLVSNICAYKRENNRTWGCISEIRAHKKAFTSASTPPPVGSPLTLGWLCVRVHSNFVRCLGYSRS